MNKKQIAVIISTALFLIIILILLTSLTSWSYAVVKTLIADELDRLFQSFGLYNYKLEIGHLNVFPLGHVTLTTIRFFVNGQDFGAINTVHAVYSIRNLLAKNFNKTMVSISADGITINADTLLDYLSLYQQGSNEFTINPIKLDFIDKLPEFEASFINITVASSKKNIPHVFIPVIHLESKSAQLNGKLLAAFNLSIPPGGNSLEENTVSLPVMLNFIADNQKITGTIGLSANSNEFYLKKVDIDFVYSMENLNASINGIPGISLCTARYNFSDNSIRTNINLNNFKISSILEVPKSLKKNLPTSITGSLDLASDFTAAGTYGALTITGNLPFGITTGSMNFIFSGSGMYENFNCTRLELRDSNIITSYAGSINFNHLEYEGTVRTLLLSKTRQDIDISSYLTGNLEKLFLYAPEIITEYGSLHNISVDLFLQKNNEVSFFINVGKAEDLYNKLSIQGSIQDLSFNNIFFTLDTYNFSVSPVLSIIEKIINSSIAQIADDIAVTTKITYQKNQNKISVQSFNTIFTWQKKSDEFLVFSFIFQDNYFTINNITYNSSNLYITGRMGAEIKKTNDISLLASMTVNSIAYAIEADFYNNALFVTINNNFRIRLVQDGNYYFSSFELKDFPINYNNELDYITSKGNAFFENLNNWKIQFDNVSMFNSKVSIYSSGEIDNNGFLFPDIKVSQLESSLVGNGMGKWNIDSITPYFDIVAKFSNNINEKIDLLVTSNNDNLSGTITIEKFSLKWFGFPESLGRISSNVIIEGSLANPVIIADVQVNQRETINTLPYFSTECTYTNGIGEFSNVQILYGPISFTNGHISLKLDTMETKLAGVILFTLQGAVKNSTIAMHCNATGTWQINDSNDNSAALTQKTNKETYRIAGLFDKININDENFVDWPLDVILNKNYTSISIGKNQEVYFALKNSSNILFKFDRSLPISFSAEGTIDNNQLNLFAQDILVDLHYLFDFLALPVIKVESGFATGNLTFTGPLADPDINGILLPNNFIVFLPEYSQEPIGPVIEPLYVNGKSMELFQTNVSAGNGIISLRLDADLEAWIPKAVSITAAGIQDKPISINTIFSDMLINGAIVPTLSLKIDENAISITGQILYTKGDVVITPDVFSSNLSSSLSSNLIVQLQFLFGAQVSVYFPYKEFPVIQGQIAPRSSLQILYDGFTEDYSIKGRINLRNGNVLYIKRNFYLKKASIEFNESNRKFSPRVTLEAESRTVYNQDEILVKLTTLNAPLDNLIFRLESIPPLSELEIARALGQDLLQIQGGSLSVGQMLVENSDLIPQLDLTSQIEAQVIALTGLDVFYFQSQLLQKVLVDISGLSATNGTLGEYLDNTAIVGGKYLTDQLYLHGSMQVVQDPFSNITNLSVVATFGLEWANPYFTVWWQIQPQHPETLFITDQSLGIMWRIEIK